MIRAFKRLFVDHPKEVGETYVEHAGVATRMGWKLAKLSGCAFIHAVMPGAHKTTVSTTEPSSPATGDIWISY